jgi:hypothetical protein
MWKTHELFQHKGGWESSSTPRPCKSANWDPLIVVNYHNFIFINGNNNLGNFQQNNMHDFFHTLTYHIIPMYFGLTFYFQHLEQGLEAFVISHMPHPPMGQNVIDYNKLHIFLFVIKRDINLEFVKMEIQKLIMYTCSFFICTKFLLK